MVKIIHIEIPKDEFSKYRILEIVKFFGDEHPDTPMSQVDGVNCRVLIIRLTDQIYRKCMNDLEKMGVGLKYGVIDTYSVESTKPSLSRGKTITRSFQPSIPVDALKDKIWGDATLSFSYVTYVIVASIIAGIGLATNNAVSIVASMLVAPLMGPILCITVGILCRDCKMIYTGFMSEMVGIILSFVMGVVIGLCFTPFVDPSCDPEDTYMFCWPNFEQKSRGMWQGLITGLIIALASGIGANLGVAQQNIASLAGTAISAALLPPVVNSGMMFVYAAFGGFMNIKGPLTNFQIREAFLVSGISLFLFFMNIFSILVAGLCVLCLKRVTPLREKSSKYEKTPEIELKEEDDQDMKNVNIARSQTFPPSIQMDNFLVNEVNERIIDDTEYL